MAELVLTQEEKSRIESVVEQLDPDHDELFADIRGHVDPEDWPAVRERVLTSLRGELISRLAGRAVRSFLEAKAGVTAIKDDTHFEDSIRTAFIYKCVVETPDGIVIHPELEHMMEIEGRSCLPTATILNRTFNLGQIAETLMFADPDKELRQLTT